MSVDQSTLHFVKNFLYQSKLKVFADDKTNVAELLKFVLESVENNVEKDATSFFFFSLSVFQSPIF